ncbi:cytochrome P450 9e2-like [Nylanderia fulva]|uniref:cytochrome P450 9e2-like n=1 Tax=Nylanderia fulva TaxID=613905 RepID=UPI0010FB9EA6|nr:cytochrome P450 9e2-like [Nylanderia fulva]
MELFSSLLSSFGLLLTISFIGILIFVAVMCHIYFYWKNKGVLYQPDSLRSFVMNCNILLRRITFSDYTLFMYNYFPDAQYYGIWDFIRPGIYLRDPELIKNVLVREFENFHDHRNFLDEIIDPLLGKNVLFLCGNRWKEIRNKLTPSFTASKMKVTCELISKCAGELVNYLIHHQELYASVEMKQIFRRYNTDVMTTVVFGINVNSLKDQNNEFYLKGVEIINSFNGVLTIFKLMFLIIFRRFAKLLGVTGILSSAISDFFKRIVGETIRTREEQGTVRPDLIYLLTQTRDKDGANNQKITLDEIISQVLFFFFAGFETSSLLMCFIAHELALNPDIQDRLRKEVLQHLDEGHDISYELLSKMTYMDMVISETLRKYPPQISMDRICTKNYELPPSQPGYKSMTIAPGTTIMIPIYALHHDPKYFPNPDKFDPERFSQENKDNVVPYTYLPFGQGPRKCIGARFVFMKTKILIAHLLRQFILKKTEKTVEPVFDKNSFNLQFDGGFWIGLEKRDS